MNQKVSIILPTYNGGKYIKKAIDSVLAQIYINWELLVIDDGSTDDTGSILESYCLKDNRIIYLKNENNLGIQKTLNKGLKEAKGEYIARIDDDDIWCEAGKLKNQVEFLDKNKDYILVGTGVIVIDEEGNEIMRYLLPENNKEIRNKILSKNCFVHSSVLFRKDSVVNIGGYCELADSRHIEDYDLWLRMGTVGKFGNLPLYSVKFTLREGSISSKNKKEQFKKNLNLIKIYKRKYPKYVTSVIKSYLRIFLYSFMAIIPFDFITKKIIKIYKEKW